MKKERLEALGRTWLEDHYDGLCQFFEQVWQEAEQYRYCVFLARRCYNLNELFFSVFGEDKSFLKKKALSNHGLLLKGKEIARSYYENGEIPRILIVDDILIHGRSLTFFLFRLEQEIREELLGMDADERLLSQLHMAIVEAIKIRVYLMHEETILLSWDYLWCVKPFRRVSRQVWQHFSQGVSQMLLLSDVANTSFVLSTEGSLEWGDCPAGSGWTKMHWGLRERRALFYYYSLPTNSSGQIVFAVRIREPKTRVGTRWIPFVFTGEPQVPDISGKLYDLMKETVSEEVFAAFRQIFSRKMASTQKAQLIHLILSSVALHYFCKENVEISSSGLNNLGKICDIEKISRNFLADEHLIGALKQLFAETEFMEACRGWMPRWFHGIPAKHHDDCLDGGEQETLELNRSMESAMYQEGLNSERYAFQIAESGRAYSPVLDDLKRLWIGKNSGGFRCITA